MKNILLCLLMIAFTTFASGKSLVVISVEGMTCSLCVTSINQALRQTAGVIKAKASLKTGSVDVIIPDGFDTDKLLEAISKTGYKGVIQKSIELSEEL